MRRLLTACAAALLFAALPSVSAAATQRAAHTATLLTTGDLLIAGGVDQGGNTLNTAEILPSSLGNLPTIPTGVMGVAVASHTATLLPNGCVLVVGGNSAATDVAAPVASAAAKVYDPASGTWGNVLVGPQTNLLTARYNHTATLLNTGQVLICGGQDAAGNALTSCELYTPTAAPGNGCANGSFAATSSLLQARYNHTATLLKDGKVWFAGGRNPAVAATGGYLVTTERYDPGTGNFQSASPMIEARSHHTATMMGDGKVLVVGGYNFRDVLANRGVTESAEIYDPISNSVAPAASMSARRQSHSAVLDASGEVVVFGGLGNVTTTYLNSGSILVDGKMSAGSTLTTGLPIGVPTATISGVTGNIQVDMLLGKPVFGKISDGEIWFSSPAIKTTWGQINFTPASETNPAVGLRVNLAGVDVGCKTPFGPGNVASNCGNVKMTLNPAAFSNMQGQVVFFRRPGVALSGTASAGTLNWLGGNLDSVATFRSIVNGNGSTFSTTVKVPMDNAFIGKTINGGFITLTAATIVQNSSFTVTLTSGTAAIPSTLVGTDATGAGQVTLNLTFNGLDGTINFTGLPPQSFPTGTTLPQAGAQATLTATGNMAYTVDGANLSGETFTIDIATVVIRKMLFADSETYNPKTNSWTLMPPPGIQTSAARYGHTATLMPNDDKVVIGGRGCVALSNCSPANQVATPSVGFQLLYYEKNFAATTGQAAGQRAFHTSTLLPSGDIIIAGGTNGPSILSSAEIFNPASETFSPVNGAMRYVRDLHTATLLPNGRVLIAGGFTTNAASTGSTKTAEIYYPDTKRFIETSPMISSRSNHTAIMMPDGKVFVAGGFGPGDVVTGTSEIFISTESRWVPAATMPGGCERAIHATVQLKNGHILLIGGVNASGPLATTADYDPATNTWACGSVAAMPTPLRSHSATLLFDGRILVAGGNDGLGEANKSFIYDPPSNTWTATDPQPLLEPRFNHTATLLPNGTVMISGGSQRFGNVPRSIEIYHVNGSSWVTGGLGPTGMSFIAGPRAFHTMTLALNNRMYGIGGSDGVIGGNGVSLYQSAEAGYFSAKPDNLSKNSPPSFRQSVISGTSASPFLPGTNLTVNGIRFRGGTEASGGGAASANSAFSFPHLVLQQVDGSGGAASQSNGGFVVDLTTQVFLNVNNVATLDTSLTVALPATNNALPYGWYALRTGANDIYSDGKLVQVGPPKPLLAPANISGVAAGISSMTWTWDRIAGVDGYNVYNATTGVFISSIPSSLSSRATFYQTALDASATSSVLIAGYSLSGDGPLSASPTSYTLAATPVNVTIASVTFSNLLLYWGTNGNSAPGTVYEVTSSSDNFVTDVSTPVPLLFSLSANFTTITNLAANTTYFFRVRAFNLVGIPSNYSVAVSTLTRAPVSQPTVAGRTTTSIDWVWAPTPGVTNYRVYNATNSAFLNAPAVNSYSEVNLGTNTQHSIVVTAVTGAGEGPLSMSASAYTLAAVPGPGAPTASPSTGTITFAWGNNQNPLETIYNIALTQFASDGSVVKVTTAEVTTLPFLYVFGALPPSTLYGYTIKALNGDTPNIPSTALSGSTWTIPAAPTLSLVGTTPTSISVAWATNNNSSSTTYEVIYTSATSFAISSATAVSFASNYRGNSATINGLVTSTTYSILVTARNPFGQVGAPSNQITTDTFNGGAAVGSVAGVLLTNSNSAVQGSLGNGRGIRIRAPAMTFPSDVTITISSYTPLTAGGLCPGTTVLAFSITDSPALQPVGSLYLSFDFLPAELGTIPANRALLMRYEPVSRTCVPLETTVDTASGVMTARINHFSLFVVGQPAATTTAETARIFPNPYYTSRDGFVTIDNVPPAARVRIFTLRGEQVLDVKANSAGVLTWSGTNGSGRAVASGVYIVLIESGGTTKTMKLAVIR